MKKVKLIELLRKETFSMVMVEVHIFQQHRYPIQEQKHMCAEEAVYLQI